MSKFAVIATYEIVDDQIEVFVPILRARRDRCLRNEPGAPHFEILLPARNLMLFEVYENEAAFQAHRDGPMVARFREEAQHIERKLTTTCTIVE